MLNTSFGGFHLIFPKQLNYVIYSFKMSFYRKSFQFGTLSINKLRIKDREAEPYTRVTEG